MNLVGFPVSAIKRKSTVWIGAGVFALIAMGVFWAFSGASPADAPVAPSMIYHVVPVDFPVKIPKDGELQAINNIDITSQVEGSTTIQTIVPEGSSVKKGDILVTLDASAITQKIEDTTLDLQKAQDDLTTAEDLRDIQASQNATNLDAAQVALQLAQLDIKQYEEGTYPQELDNAKSDLEFAEISQKNAEEKLGQTKTLFAKGYVTESSVKDDELGVTTARNVADKARTALKVLTDYQHQMDLAGKQSTLAQAQQKLVRTKRENEANLAQHVADAETKGQALAVLKHRMAHLQEQLADCTIKAPADGLVLYASSVDRNSETAIQAGIQVHQQQLLLRLPDTSSMKAVIRIQEAQVSRLKIGQRAAVNIVGYQRPLGATLTKTSVLADNSQRWWNPDLKEYPVDLNLDETPPGLKPGMGVTAEIYIDRAVGVLAVPLSAIYSAGNDSYVFIKQDTQFMPRQVHIGRTNDTLAEIPGDALHEGDDVLILQAGQGQSLLEKAGIKISPTTKPGDDLAKPKQADHPQPAAAAK